MFVYNVDIPKLWFDEHLALHLFWAEQNEIQYETLIDCLNTTKIALFDIYLLFYKLSLDGGLTTQPE